MHALIGSIEPTRRAFDAAWPEADVAHLLDGSLYLDRSRGTASDEEIAARIARLIRFSEETGSEAVLFTGSFFGAAVRAARQELSVPVATSFEALVERAVGLETPLHVISTAADSATLLAQELEEALGAPSTRVPVGRHVVEGALETLVAGDTDRHDRLVLEAVDAAPTGSAVVFAQFSMERVLGEARDRASMPVIGPATEGASGLRRRLG